MTLKKWGLFLLYYVITSVHTAAQDFLSAEAERTIQDFYRERVEKGHPGAAGSGMIFMRNSENPEIQHKKAPMKKVKVTTPQPVLIEETRSPTEDIDTEFDSRGVKIREPYKKPILKKTTKASNEGLLHLRAKDTERTKKPFPTRPPKKHLKRRTKRTPKPTSSEIFNVPFTHYLHEARAKVKRNTHPEEDNMKPNRNVYTMKPKRNVYTMKPKRNVYTMKPNRNVYTMKPNRNVYTVKPNRNVFTTHARYVQHASFNPSKKKHNSEVKSYVTHTVKKLIKNAPNEHKRRVHPTTSTTTTTKIHNHEDYPAKRKKQTRKHTATTQNMRNHTWVKHLIKEESFFESIHPITRVFRKPKPITTTTTTTTDPPNIKKYKRESTEQKLFGEDLYNEKDIAWENTEENEQVPHPEPGKHREPSSIIRELKSSNRKKHKKNKPTDKHEIETTQPTEIEMEYAEAMTEMKTEIKENKKSKEANIDPTYIDVFKDVDSVNEEETQTNKAPKKKKERHKHKKQHKVEEKQQHEETQKSEEIHKDDDDEDEGSQKFEEFEKTLNDDERTKGTELHLGETDYEVKIEDGVRAGKHREQKHKVKEKHSETQEQSLQEEGEKNIPKGKQAWKNENLSFLTPYQQEKLKTYLEHKRKKKLLRSQNEPKGTQKHKTKMKHKRHKTMRGTRQNAEPNGDQLDIFYRKAQHKVIIDPDLLAVSFSLDSKGDVKESESDLSEAQEQNGDAVNNHGSLEAGGLEIPVHHHNNRPVMRSQMSKENAEPSSQETMNTNPGEEKKSDQDAEQGGFFSYQSTAKIENEKSLKTRFADERKGLSIQDEPIQGQRKRLDQISLSYNDDDTMDKIVQNFDKENHDFIHDLDHIDVFKYNDELNYDLSQEPASAGLKYKLASDTD